MEDCEPLATFCESLIRKISEFSLELQNDGSFRVPYSWTGGHPYQVRCFKYLIFKFNLFLAELSERSEESEAIFHFYPIWETILTKNTSTPKQKQKMDKYKEIIDLFSVFLYSTESYLKNSLSMTAAM